MPMIDLGFGDTFISTFKPDSISVEYMPLIFKDVPESVKEHARKLRDNHWRFYAVSQTRGYCLYRERVITIPTWVININKTPDITKKIWYIAHEIAHALTSPKHKPHGPEFMENLKLVCPPDCIHHELGYKPRNAKAAGIWNI